MIQQKSKIRLIAYGATLILLFIVVYFFLNTPYNVSPHILFRSAPLNTFAGYIEEINIKDAKLVVGKEFSLGKEKKYIKYTVLLTPRTVVSKMPSGQGVVLNTQEEIKNHPLLTLDDLKLKDYVSIATDTDLRLRGDRFTAAQIDIFEAPYFAIGVIVEKKANSLTVNGSIIPRVPGGEPIQAELPHPFLVNVSDSTELVKNILQGIDGQMEAKKETIALKDLRIGNRVSIFSNQIVNRTTRSFVADQIFIDGLNIQTSPLPTTVTNPSTPPNSQN